MLTIIDWVSLLIILLAGVPHGALDYELIQQQQILKDKTFLTLYTGLTFFGIAFWLAQPTLALLIFLAITTIHFGRSDPLKFQFHQTNRKLLCWSMIYFQGGVVTILIPITKWEFVLPLFEHLGTDPTIFGKTAPAFFSLWVFCGLFSLVTLFRDRNFLSIGLTTTMLAAAIVFPPLLGFALYFCGLHSLGHYQRGMLYLKRSVKKPSRRLILLTILTWLLMGGLTYILEFNATVDASVIGGIFILLFALTVPHMLIIDLILPRRDPYWSLIWKTVSNNLPSKK